MLNNNFTLCIIKKELGRVNSPKILYKNFLNKLKQNFDNKNSDILISQIIEKNKELSNMKIHQLLSGVHIPMTNEEQRFIDRHDTDVKMTSLDEHDSWIAQNLVRKGAYSVSNDSSTLTRTINETNK